MIDKRRLLRLAGIGLIVLAILLAVYIFIGYLAWQSGQTVRVERAREEQQAEVENQLKRAREDVESGNYQLALRRLEWILEQNPTYPGARGLRDVAQAQLDGEGLPTPTPPVAPTKIPTSTSASAASTDDKARELRRLEQLVEEAAWQQAVDQLVAFQNEYPDYERRKTDRLLYEAFLGRGVDLLYGNRVELGLFYLSEAEALGDLPTEARDQRQWAELYLAGMGYYGVNWDVAIFYFRDLCRAAPFYQDSCEKLRVALIAFGDQYVVQQEWCPAEEYYAEAYRLEESRELADRLGETREACLSATPTPPTTSDTVPVTNSWPFSVTPIPFSLPVPDP